MSRNDYNFVTHWRIPGTAEEIAAVLGNAPDLPRWWPAVYLKVTELAPGDESGVGRVVDLYTKGWLPYTLRWKFRVTEIVPLQRIVLRAEGDFVGEGIWTFAQQGSETEVTYEWRIRAEKPLLRRLSILMKPIFAANHRWAMRTGEESLRLELARRRTQNPIERSRIPAPPGPTPSSPIPLLLMSATVLLVIWALLRPRPAQ